MKNIESMIGLKLLSLALCLFILCACTDTEEVPFDDPTAGITVTAAADQPELNTSLIKMADISDYDGGSDRI